MKVHSKDDKNMITHFNKAHLRTNKKLTPHCVSAEQPQQTSLIRLYNEF